MLAKYRTKLVLVILDCLCLVLAGLLSLLFRFDGNPEAAVVLVWASTVPVALPFHLLLYYWFGLYSQIWRYAALRDLVRVTLAVMTSTLLAFVFTQLLPIPPLSRGVILLSCCFNLAGVCVIRMLARLRGEYNPSRQPGGSRTLIVGAGDAGSLLVREIFRHPELGFQPVGFLDDDQRKIGQRICGLPVIGSLGQLEEIVGSWEIETVIVAMPSAPARVVKQLTRRCKGLGVRAKTVPGLFEILSGRQAISQVRDVQIEDLLPRKLVQVDVHGLTGYLRGKTVLVTGAGGSIGSELCRQAARCSVDHLLLLGHGEDSIYRIHGELTKDFPGLKLTPLIADIRDRERMASILSKYQPEIVYHAAAHKHVPLMELNPEDAVSNNIFGTLNVAELASQAGVESFVMLSTDKAVNPSSVMGATKRMAELVLQALAVESSTSFVAVRFGNVLGSRGSVIPLFQEQIAAGGPVTVTHPEMTRYFMTIPEAVNLVMQAGALGKGGEIFILDMGQPVRILDLVQELIRLSGLEPGIDIPVKVIGARRGEKLHEELVDIHETSQPTTHPHILVINRPPIDQEAVQNALMKLEDPGIHGNVQHLIQLINLTARAYKAREDRP